jgi:ribonuclease G
MAKEICISTTPHETRLAILEDDQLAEIYYERENEYTLAGSIYKGRVTRVLPGMQSSFVDIGLERDAFLYVTDFLEEQEDSEEYATDGNGHGRRESRPRSDAPEEGQVAGQIQGRAASPDRHQERNGERNQDRGRRSAPPAESPRESGRAAREQAREQVVAPLRAAVPAAQDIEEKGDDEAPEGTRRWRGRRGRRRGVRGGLPKGEPPSLLSDSPEPLEEASIAEQAAAPFAIAEHGAPGGIASLHAAPSNLDDESARPAEPGRGRGPRRSREPYAQVSTLDRPAREAAVPLAVAPQPAGGVVILGGAIVLPGESISKYGSVPADPGVTPVAATATVPKTVRPVNYIAPKPSTLVELAGEWDGGAVLPGETLSRYQSPAASKPVPDTAAAEEPVEAAEEVAAAEVAVEPVGAEEALLEQASPVLETVPADTHDEAEVTAAEPVEVAATPEHSAPEPVSEPALAEPEIVAAAFSVEHEALASSPEAETVAETPAGLSEPVTEEPVEYEPENASVSFRVQSTAPSELRLPTPEAEKEDLPEPAPAAHFEQAQSEQFPEPFPEPTGHFLDSEPLSKSAEEPFGAVPEFAGTLAAQADESHDARLQTEEPWSWTTDHAAPPLQILHEDGTVDLAQTDAEANGHLESSSSLEAQAFEFEQALSHVAEAQPSHPSPTEFSDLVDRLQGFAPGHGLLEEETIDEEEYDFEPMHAHADEGDQEDLEEETLDHVADEFLLSDAVRDSHLEQRVEPSYQAAAPAASIAEEIDEHEPPFGFEVVEDGDDDLDEDGGEEATAPGGPSGEPQRRGEEGRSRSGGRGRSGGRNGGRRNGGPGRGGRSAQTQDLPIISELLKQGQEILVQIAKEPIAKKGARITSHIALPGRFLVFMPTVHHVGVSRKIASDEERQRLKRILISEKGENSGGFIVRTAAEGASEEDLRADLRFLISLWNEIKQRADSAKAPALIYHDLNLIERILRDQVSSNFSTIWVDSEAEYERIIRFLHRFQPQLVRRVKLYTKETPLFEHFGIQEEISKALKSKVWLKSGGSIVINQTEALVAIDINTGKYVGKTARLEDTIVKTNLDAIPEIVRQIRLRDLGGIIVIDFIDMDERKNRNRVLAALEEELKNDRAPSKVLQFNDFGLVAITRKRVKQSLERTLSVTCETCTGTGMVKSPITVCNEIYIEMRKMMKHLDGKDVMLRVNPEVVKQLKANNGKWINELEEMVAKTIIIKSDPALHPEQFDIH